jgi:DNA polymerase III epsilon subunit-like protein
MEYRPASLSRLVIDVETDGVGSFRPPEQRVVQLAYGAWRAGETCVPASYLVRGVQEIHPRAAEVHGIGVELLREKGVALAEAASGLMAAIGSCDVVIGHNVQFDIGCVLHSLRAEGLFAEARDMESALSTKRVVCTMRHGVGVSRRCGGKFPTLSELYRAIFREGPDGGRLHDAGYDCELAARCYDAMFPEPDEPGAKRARIE